ncbi:hypothetical protein [Nostoc sp.]
MKILSYSYPHSNWALGIGYWVLVIGHWSLVIGHWSLVTCTERSRWRSLS